MASSTAVATASASQALETVVWHSSDWLASSANKIYRVVDAVRVRASGNGNATVGSVELTVAADAPLTSQVGTGKGLFARKRRTATGAAASERPGAVCVGIADACAVGDSGVGKGKLLRSFLGAGYADLCE